MNRLKTILLRAALLALALLLLCGMLVACGDRKSEDESSESDSSPTVEEVILADFFNGAAEEYVIIYPDSSGTTVKNAAKSLTVTLNNAYGLDLKSRTDKKIEAKEDAREILVGETNRAESQSAKEKNTDNEDFVIEWVGNRLVLVGGNHDGTARAVQYLIDTYIVGKDNETLMIDENMALEWKYKVECAALFEVVNSYKIIHGDLATAGEKKLAKQLAKELSDITDVDIKAETDYVKGVSNKVKDHVSEELEILIGATNRKESNNGEALSYMDYEIRFTDTKIVLRGGSMEALHRAVLDLQERLVSGSIKDLKDSANSTVSLFMQDQADGSMLAGFDSFKPAWASSYTPKPWMTDLNEKVSALTAMNGRNMSASLGGDTKNYPSHSPEAIASAIQAGVDFIELNVQQTRDGVMVVFPTEELMGTNAADLEGVDGLPVSGKISDWTYEELSRVRFVGNGKTSAYSILTMYEAIGLINGHCFFHFNMPESDYDVNSIMGDVLAEHGAYLSYFQPDPTNNNIAVPKTVSTLKSWYMKDLGNEKLKAAIDKYEGLLKEDNRSVRKLFSDNQPESEARWQALREEFKTFLYANDVVTYCQYISDKYPSALVNIETLKSQETRTINVSDLKGRVMIFSDTHYALKNNLLGENKGTDEANQQAQLDHRVAEIVKMIKAEYFGSRKNTSNKGLDAVAILGDLGTDDGNYASTNYYRTLYAELIEGLENEGINNLPIYVLAGNHDSVPNATWKGVFGTDRQHSFVVDEKLFLMLDTFDENYQKDDPGSGGKYHGVTAEDMTWIGQQIAAHPGKEVVVCSHSMTSSDYNKIANAYPEVSVFYQGHTHLYEVTKLNSGAYYIDEGGFSYTAFSQEGGGGWNFGYLDQRSLWGYQILEWSENTTATYHVFIAHEYFATNMHYTIPEIKTTDVILKQVDVPTA